MDPCPGDANDDADGDGVCTQCCGGFLGPNEGADGEYEVAIDLCGETPGVVGNATAGVFTIRAHIYVTEDWDGSSMLLHSRVWDVNGDTITSISGDDSTSVREQWYVGSCTNIILVFRFE